MTSSAFMMALFLGEKTKRPFSRSECDINKALYPISILSRSSVDCIFSINVHVKKGSLVAIVGQVGSGKSSLLSAVLGEMEKSSGEVIKNVMLCK